MIIIRPKSQGCSEAETEISGEHQVMRTENDYRGYDDRSTNGESLKSRSSEYKKYGWPNEVKLLLNTECPCVRNEIDRHFRSTAATLYAVRICSSIRSARTNKSR